MLHRKRWGAAAAASVIGAGIVSGAPGSNGAADAVGHGREIYRTQCAQCHGPTGRGDGRAACDFDLRPTDLTDPDLAGETDAALIRRMLHARKPMPDFENVLTAGERRAVAAYVRTLSARKPALASGGDR